VYPRMRTILTVRAAAAHRACGDEVMTSMAALG
jgi:hypothetical protein